MKTYFVYVVLLDGKTWKYTGDYSSSFAALNVAMTDFPAYKTIWVRSKK